MKDNKKKKNKIQILDVVPFFILVGIIAFFAIATGGISLSTYNIQMILIQVVPVIVGSLGCIFVIALGGTDISIGASAALCASLAAMMSAKIGFGPIAIPITLLLSTLVGIFIGFIVVKFKVGSFICTLAILIAARGVLNYYVQKGFIAPPAGIDFVGSLPFAIGVIVLLTLVVWFVFDRTKFGFYCKCIGENERTVKAVGINVNKIRITCFAISGFMAGVIGFIQIVKVGGGTSALCNMLEMKVQMAIFLGGILTTGGFSAKIYKLILGSFTIIVIENGLQIMGVSSDWAEFIEGIVLVLILIVTIYCSKVATANDLKMAAEEEKALMAEQAAA